MEISRGAGVSKAQFLKGGMMLNWNFWRVGGGGFELSLQSLISLLIF